MTSNGNAGELNVGEIASLVSMVMALCSAILGLLLGKRIQGLGEKDVRDIVRDAFRRIPKYLNTRHCHVFQANYLGSWLTPRNGLLKLAIMYSLPFGMLMWRSSTSSFSLP